jgi:hypothetical protein
MSWGGSLKAAITKHDSYVFFLLSSQLDRQYGVWRMELSISQNSILTPRECLALEPNTSIIMRPSV